jgi:hypothetical protein
VRHPLIASAAANALASAASAEVRTVTAFDAISASDRIPVEVTQGDAFRVEVIGSDAARVRTELDGETLEIRQRNRPWFGGTPRIDARVIVTMPSVVGLAASRGASIRAESIRGRDVSLAASMGGAIDISGACQTLSVSASMGASIDADAFQCATANISASMGADVQVFASRTYNASASMGGAVRVDGGAQQGGSSASMGGAIVTN